MNSTDKAIDQTRKWINDVVVGCNFCPFAARAMNRNAVVYRVIDHEDVAVCLQALLDECIYLDEHAETETSFLLFPDGFKDFLEYLDMVALAEELLEAEGFEGVYQVASFHPDYRFEGAPTADPANYTNRSPYPMLHLLREESIEKALQHYEGDPEEIPERNVGFARNKGLAYMKLLRDTCME